MNETLVTLVRVSAIVFVISSMLAMGLSLLVPQIIAPLRNVKLVVLALAVNFVAVPLVAVGINAVIDLDADLYTGLLLVATAAGAPFLPKLAQVAKGNIALSVGLMVLLMVVTVVYMPLVLPLLLTDVEVNAWDIARSLIVMMLLPLGIGLFTKARWRSIADSLQPVMSQTSSVAIVFMLVAGIVMSWSDIVDLIGTGGLLAAIIFLAASLALGYVAGGSDAGTRSVLGLGTAQRNLSAALVVGAQNFSGDALVFVVVIAFVGLAILIPVAGEFGRMAGTTPDAG
ncbi:MAG: bile acid:sodium symporter family protein [Armatimonadetes bacterium]|nr:MAG: bile acid:sodium symporter family protein [Armatimonadota bacterium]